MFLCRITGQPQPYNRASNLANIYFKQDQWSEAAACYRQVLRINANQAASHFNLGLCLQKLGRIEEACDSYRQALAHDPNHADAPQQPGQCTLCPGSL